MPRVLGRHDSKDRRVRTHGYAECRQYQGACSQGRRSLDRDSERREGVLQPIYEERARLNREAEAERVRLEREADLNHRKQIALMIGMLAALALTPAIVVGTVYRGRMKELHARIGGLETRMTEMRNEIAAERAALAGIQRAQETPAETETDSQPVPADTEKNRNESEV